jgi:predicted unusual protein kinase regulating ubiquinone biosynthesis (AarF/ABC1/UbiB family)
VISTIFWLAFILPIFIIVYYQAGYFGAYLKVKASRGKKILVKVKSMTSHYYRVGKIAEGFLHFKDKEKQKHVIAMQEGAIYRICDVNCIDVDEETNTIFSQLQKKEVSGFDAVRFDGLITRALQRPMLQNPNLVLILIIGILVVCLGLGFMLYQNYKLQKTAVDISLQTLDLLKTMQPSITPTPGVV